MDRDDHNQLSHGQTVPDTASSTGPLNESPLEAARRYVRDGCAVVPVPYGEKGPVLKGWNTLRLTEAQLPQHFRKRTNIGILTGEPSGWRVDVDMDCDEAVKLGSSMLPATECKTGRPGNPDSHWWYVAPGAVTRQFKDPFTDEMIIELRSTGGQTVVGPSVHPDGDRYDPLRGAPASTTADALLAIVESIAKEVIKQRYGDVPIPEERAPSLPLVRTNVSHDQAQRRASAYLARMPGAISGQGGHSKTYAAATVLVHGFELDTVTALRMLMEQYNPRCEPPWTEKELRHKVEDAANKPHDRPRGWLLHASQAPDLVAPPSVSNTASSDRDEDGLIPLGTRDPDSGRLVLSPKKTLPTAEAYVREFNQHVDGRTLHGYGGLLMEWHGNRYCQVEDGAIKQRLQPWLHNALRYVLNKRTGEMELVRFESNPTTVKQALETISSLVHLPASTASPSWLDGGKDRPPALELLPCKSMSLHIPTRRILSPTPALFNVNALDFDYDPNAEPPEKWINFLVQLFGDDIQAVELLQEWMGYCLTGDTSQQKMVLIVGPRRSGKGTIGRIITRLVGAGNVVGPTTSSLAGNFGLQPLIGKSLAVVSDARFSGENVGTVVERLLCIVGEDTLTIDRKFLGAVSMKLPTRFMFLTNELPRLTDASNALSGRFLVLRLNTSFYGQEDVTLTDKLITELPGILLWAIEGWERLRRRGKFLQPKSGEEAIHDMEDLASPVGAFVRERCVVGPGHRVWLDTLYEAWTRWCQQEGRSIVSMKQTFGRDLVAACAGVTCRRSTGLVRFYDGIALKGDIPV